MAAPAPQPIAFAIDVGAADPDVGTVDALARLQLAAGAHGCRIVLRHASEELRDLLAFLGLDDVLAEEGATTRAAAAGRTAGRASRSRGRT